MSQAFAKTSDNYSILYRFSNVPYTPNSSWTTSTAFVPDSKLDTQEFIPEPVLEKSEFILNPEWCR